MQTILSEIQQRERIATRIYPTADAAAAELAARIAALIRSRAAEGRRTVLGLATGSTPVRLYRQLIRLHREERLSFRDVVTFNLDEYYGLPRTHPESYWRFMHEQLFAHIDVSPANIQVPDGTIPRGGVFAACQRYEEQIAAAGGIDLQILGIGRTGHIGFNEPGSAADSRTRLVTLDRLTCRDAARDFLGEANVPRHAITMGVGTILAAREIVLLAWGAGKAGIVARAVEEEPSDSLPASFLQGHPNVSFLVDTAAASALCRCQHPWLVGPVEWTPHLIRRAVIWLARRTGKPVLKLLDEDYSEHGMADLLTAHGPAYAMNIRIFNELQHTITGWPGGKPGADDTHRPESAEPARKRIVVFSPEPSQDVLGMGGTLRRLVEQGHDVHVVYLTSGNLAVPDDEAMIATDLVASVAQAFGAKGPVDGYAARVRGELARKTAFENDSAEVRLLKGLLRRGEARAAMQASAVPLSRIRFLDLGFYERGRYRQFTPNADDVRAVAAVLRELAPHRIYATGQHDDPSSLAAVCFEIIRHAWQEESGQDWQRLCRLWLYRGPESAWDTAEIDMAVPLSPRELAQKIQAIYQHKSQRSQTAGPDPGLREPWQLAEQRNRELGELYDRLGLANYEAIEAFARLP
ncbi:MAG TPA: glucosamine-6-phosphate deaminase [Lacunisphaera sp.]|nr:glucosamine-6-phosphate deaminase [Lacunisphaera sp.]